jgi:acetyl-CoA carboxylase biotin carboxyl carrier protein
VRTLSSDTEAIRRVIEAFEKSNWSEIDVRVGSVRVHLRADGAPTAGLTLTGSTSAIAERAEVAAQPEPISDRPAPGDDAILVRSPSPGIYWRSPQPGAPPFADVGQQVDATSTLCIVEVMKLMNHVKAGVAGRVIAVFGRDGVAVDKDEPLFAIDSGERPA